MAAREVGEVIPAPTVGVILDYGSGERVAMEPIRFQVAREGIVRLTMREVVRE